MQPCLPGRGPPPQVVGVLNATPDSFSGDGLGSDVAALVRVARAQVAAGAALLDLGGESTHPRAQPVPADEERRRVLPALEGLVRAGLGPISIDTSRAVVAEAALAAGATVVNDVSGLRDPGLAAVAARHRAWLVLMHNGWTMPAAGGRGDVVARVVDGLLDLVRAATAGGVLPDRIVVDPGLGFGKAPRESLELLRRTVELRGRLAPFPLLVGPSRKGFIGRALGAPVDARLEGTLACVAVAVAGGAELVRVHDVAPAVQVARMARAIHDGLAARLAAPP